MYQKIKKNKTYRKIADKVWQLWYKILSLQYLWKPKKDLLVYLGLNRGMNLSRIYWHYKKVIGIEADPNMCNHLIKKFNSQSQIQIINAAASFEDGTIKFNIAANDGQASTIGLFKNELKDVYKFVKTIEVPCINVGNYLKKMNIEQIDDYISDIQGMDLEVLKTMDYYIENKLIKRITCEVSKEKYKTSYINLPDNSETGFKQLLEKNYKLIAIGDGLLKENKFDTIPEEYWDLDCMWKLKN